MPFIKVSIWILKTRKNAGKKRNEIILFSFMEVLSKRICFPFWPELDRIGDRTKRKNK